MKPSLRWFSYWIATFAVACSLASPARADGPQWVEVKSPHFSVATDAGEKRGREVAMRFEQMRAVFAALMVKARVNLPVPLQIVAFRNSKEMREFAPLWQGKPTQVAGLFQGGEDRSFIMLDMSTENPWKVVFHEYGHQLLDGNLSMPTAAWFEEGFAEYFSSIEVDNKEARVGKVPDYYYLVLRQTGSMKVPDLFKVRQNSQTYNESGDHRTVFYAESGMMVHYLYDRQLLPKLNVYFDLTMAKRMTVEDAIQKAFGISAAQLDKDFQNYIYSGQFKYFPIPTPANIVSTGYTTAPLSELDSRAILADIHLHSPDYKEKAIAEFGEILKTDPNHAAANRGLGYAYLHKGQYKNAAAYFSKAAQADSKDPRVHYYSAMLLSRDGGYSSETSREEMIRELETAIALDPSYADAYMLLGYAQGFSGDRAKGLETAQKALALNPRNPVYQFNVAQMYLSNQKFDQAIALLRGLENSGNPVLAAQASSSLRQAEQMKETMSEDSDRQEDSDEVTVEMRPSTANSQDKEQPPAAPEPSSQGPRTPPKIGFVRGVLKEVDCSSPPSALLTVVAGTKSWKMKVTDTNHVVMLGADKFSCSWARQKVALNYRVTGDAEGTVVSLELE